MDKGWVGLPDRADDHGLGALAMRPEETQAHTPPKWVRDITWMFAKMPSTNVRIGWTVVLAVMTGIRVVWWEWVPPETWLGFLVIMAGLDAAQFYGKRRTHREGGTAT